MSRSDFSIATPQEFEAIVQAWTESRLTDQQEAWERARLIAYMAAAPHLSRKMTPRQLIPLPWDTEARKPSEAEAERLTPEQQRRRFEELSRRLSN